MSDGLFVFRGSASRKTVKKNSGIGALCRWCMSVRNLQKNDSHARGSAKLTVIDFTTSSELFYR